MVATSEYQTQNIIRLLTISLGSGKFRFCAERVEKKSRNFELMWILG